MSAKSNADTRVALVSRITKLLTDPAEEWSFNNYVARHRDTGLQIWVANVPLWNVDTYPTSIHPSPIDKWRLWKAVKIAKRNAMMRQLGLWMNTQATTPNPKSSHE